MDFLNWLKLSTYVGKKKEMYISISVMDFFITELKILYYSVRLDFFDFWAWCLTDRELNSTEDLADWLESAYSYLAMVDYPYPSDFMMPLPGYPIREVSWICIWFGIIK